MTTTRNALMCIAAALGLVPAAAAAGPLTIVEVGPAVTCLFHANCIVGVSDTVGHLALPNLDKPNTAMLQSRTYQGAAGTAGAGLWAYEYRLDLTAASGSVECLAGLVVNFGPLTKLPYKAGALADIFVLTSGGIGSIGLKSAEQDGDVVTFELAQLLCVGTTPSSANTTFLFGLAAAKPPMPITAGVYGIGNPPYIGVPARAPTH